jgi:hypothetical protein
MAKSIYHPKGSKTFRDSSGIKHSVKTPHGPKPNPGLIKPRKLSAGEARFNRMYEQSDRGVNSASSGPSTVAPKPSNRLDAIRGKEKLTAAELSEAKKFGIDPDKVLAMKYGIPKKLTKVGPGVSDEQAARGLPKKLDAIKGGSKFIGPSKFTTNHPALKPGEKLDQTNGEIVRTKKNLPGDHLSKDGKVVLDKDNEIVRLTAKGKRGSVSQRLQLLRQEVENQKSGKFDAIRGGQLSDVKKLVAAHDKAVQKAYVGNGSEKTIEKIANKAFEKHGVSLYVTAQPGMRETEGLTKTGRDLRPVLARAERMAAAGGGGGRGKGRGNWGHKGRPGKRGGSA